MGYELAEDFGWKLPDAILYPTGGGTGLIGMWKAFDEMEEMGWIGSARPKMFAVQAEGCAPIPKAFAEGKTVSEKFPERAHLRLGTARAEGVRRLPDPRVRPRLRRLRPHGDRRRDARGLRRDRRRRGPLRRAGGRRRLGGGEEARARRACSRPTRESSSSTPGAASSTSEPGTRWPISPEGSRQTPSLLMRAAGDPLLALGASRRRCGRAADPPQTRPRERPRGGESPCTTRPRFRRPLRAFEDAVCYAAGARRRPSLGEGLGRARPRAVGRRREREVHRIRGTRAGAVPGGCRSGSRSPPPEQRRPRPLLDGPPRRGARLLHARPRPRGEHRDARARAAQHGPRLPLPGPLRGLGGRPAGGARPSAGRGQAPADRADPERSRDARPESPATTPGPSPATKRPWRCGAQAGRPLRRGPDPEQHRQSSTATRESTSSALAMHRQTLRLAHEIGYTRQIGLSHENIGARCSTISGVRGDALAEACAAIAFYRRTGDRSNLASTLSNAGGYLVELGELDEARVSSMKRSPSPARSASPRRKSHPCRAWPKRTSRRGARPTRSRCSTLPSALPKPPVSRTWSGSCASTGLAPTACSGGTKRASPTSGGSGRRSTDLRIRVGTDAGKIGFLDQPGGLRGSRRRALAEAHRDQEALETAEAARARALADLLSQRSVSGKPADRAALAEVRGAQARARRVGRPRRRSRGRRSGACAKRIRELASLVSVESPRLDEIRLIAAAPRRDARRVLRRPKDACYAWVVTPDGALHAARLAIDRARLARDVTARPRMRLEAVGLVLAGGASALARTDALARRAPDRSTRRVAAGRDPTSSSSSCPTVPLALRPVCGAGRRVGPAPRRTPHARLLSGGVGLSLHRVRRSEAGGRPALVVADPMPPARLRPAALPGSRREAALRRRAARKANARPDRRRSDRGRGQARRARRGRAPPRDARPDQ